MRLGSDRRRRGDPSPTPPAAVLLVAPRGARCRPRPARRAIDLADGGPVAVLALLQDPRLRVRDAEPGAHADRQGTHRQLDWSCRTRSGGSRSWGARRTVRWRRPAIRPGHRTSVARRRGVAPCGHRSADRGPAATLLEGDVAASGPPAARLGGRGRRRRVGSGPPPPRTDAAIDPMTRRRMLSHVGSARRVDPNKPAAAAGSDSRLRAPAIQKAASRATAPRSPRLRRARSRIRSVGDRQSGPGPSPGNGPHHDPGRRPNGNFQGHAVEDRERADVARA